MKLSTNAENYVKIAQGIRLRVAFMFRNRYNFQFSSPAFHIPAPMGVIFGVENAPKVNSTPNFTLSVQRVAHHAAHAGCKLQNPIMTLSNLIPA